MASKEQIKKVILDLAGNPSVGAIYSLSDKWAEAIWKLDNKDAFFFPPIASTESSLTPT